jgi:hypothetical protein
MYIETLEKLDVSASVPATSLAVVSDVTPEPEPKRLRTERLELEPLIKNQEFVLA